MMKPSNGNKENYFSKARKNGTISRYNRRPSFRKIITKKQPNTLVDDKSTCVESKENILQLLSQNTNVADSDVKPTIGSSVDTGFNLSPIPSQEPEEISNIETNENEQPSNEYTNVEVKTEQMESTVSATSEKAQQPNECDDGSANGVDNVSENESGNEPPNGNDRRTIDFLGQPKGNTRQTPSKTQPKGKSAPQQQDESDNESDNGSDNGEDNVPENEYDNESSNGNDRQSNNSNISDDSIDFLGRPPSHEPSESNDQPSEDANENTQQTIGPSVSRPSRGERRHPRKQSAPKNKRDRITSEIRKLRQSTKFLLPRLTFHRLVREILQQFKQDYRMQSSSLECLQEATESFLVQLFEDSYLCCLHRSRVTLTQKDIELLQILRGPTDVGRR